VKKHNRISLGPLGKEADIVVLSERPCDSTSGSGSPKNETRDFWIPEHQIQLMLPLSDAAERVATELKSALWETVKSSVQVVDLDGGNNVIKSENQEVNDNAFTVTNVGQTKLDSQGLFEPQKSKIDALVAKDAKIGLKKEAGLKQINNPMQLVAVGVKILKINEVVDRGYDPTNITTSMSLPKTMQSEEAGSRFKNTSFLVRGRLLKDSSCYAASF